MVDIPIDNNQRINQNNNQNNKDPQSIQEMNYMATQMALGLSTNKSIDNKMSSMIMNIGKVQAGVNKLDLTMTSLINVNKSMDNKLSAVNMNISKVVQNTHMINFGILSLIDNLKKNSGSVKNTNVSIGHMSTRLTSLEKEQRETNKLLSQIFSIRRNGTSKYEKTENELEARKITSGDEIISMSNSLKSIDRTLKQILSQGGGLGGGGGGGGGGGFNFPVPVGGFGALFKKILPIALKGAAIYGGDWALGKYANVGGNTIDYAQDNKNWNRMNFVNKVESSVGRGIETVGGVIAPNIANEATNSRIRDETNYFKDLDNSTAAQFFKFMKKKNLERDIEARRSKLNSDKSLGPSFEQTGRASSSLNTSAMDFATSGEVQSRYWESRKFNTKDLGIPSPPNTLLDPGAAMHDYYPQGAYGGNDAGKVWPNFKSPKKSAIDAYGDELEGRVSSIIRDEIKNGKWRLNPQAGKYETDKITYDPKTNMYSNKSSSSQAVSQQSSSFMGNYPNIPLSTNVQKGPSINDINWNPFSSGPEKPNYGGPSGLVSNYLDPTSMKMTLSNVYDKFAPTGMLANMPGVNYGGPSGTVSNYTDPTSMKMTTDTLTEQNSAVERRDKATTSGDMVYNAQQITYKANIVRFDASSIVFNGGGGAGAGGAGGGGGAGGAGGGGAGAGGAGGGGAGAGGAGGGGGGDEPVPQLPSFPDATPSQRQELLSKGVVPNGPQGGALGPGLLPGQVPEVPKDGKYRPQYKLTSDDLSLAVTETIAGEAHMDNPEGVDAVINNMFNRLGGKDYGPSSNLHKVATARGQYVGRRKVSKEEFEYIKSRIEEIAAGNVPDNTNNSNEYRADWYLTGQGRGKTAFRRAKSQGWNNIGGNVFFNNPNAKNGPYAPYSEPKLNENGEILLPNWNAGTQNNASSSSTSKSPGFLNINQAAGVDENWVKIMQRAGEIAPGLFGMPTEEDANRVGASGIAPGLRTIKQQIEMIRKGWSKTKKSKHIEGTAGDVWPINPATGTLDPNYMPGYDTIEKPVRQAAEELGFDIEWGGNWKNFKDRPHWQLKKKSISGKSWNPEKEPGTFTPGTENADNLHPDIGYSPVQNEMGERSIRRRQMLDAQRERLDETNRKRRIMQHHQVVQQSAANREKSSQPLPTTVPKKEMHSILVRHNDWYKNFSATVA